ncbi:helix-hairpin-helix domain-containing protein [Lactobacillus porci]|uniref:ComEA family DNA-binding protein n=1 Tax=Lactobacillus porci TaxID=2012477 RepID=A0A6A8MB22_9LACO|nr:helix-hairpin-helix domain-containing protein [Lactobacillus porci]MST86293.1 ComEA family DNA-binding protein [Lactobacillus porci]
MKKINPDQIKNWLLDKKVYVVAVVLAAGAFFYWQQKPQPADNSALLSQTKLQSSSQSAASRQTGASSASSAASGKVVCDISGAVKEEGVYTLKSGSRLQDLIDAAGGLTSRAQIKAINRSLLLQDQDKVYIPYKGEKTAAAPTAGMASNAAASSSSSSSSPAASSAAGKVNLNTATAADLQKLNGIGERKAEQIIAYREQKGGFKSIDELKEVSGIGDKTFDALKDQITV